MKHLSLSGVVSDLHSTDPVVRGQAVDRLANIGGSEAAGALVLLLSDPDESIRRRAADALVALGTAAIEPVSRCVSNWQGPVGTLVPELIGRLGLDSAVGLLARNATDRDPETRAAIAVALGRIGGRAAIPPLLDLLRDLVDSVRIAAARALGEIRDPSTVDALMDEMADDNPEMRCAAATALGRLRHRKAVELLARISSEDPDPEVRRAALEALRSVSVQAVDPLIRALASEDLSDRLNAMTALLDQGKTALIPVAELLVNENPTVRASAAEVLGGIGDPSCIEALAGVLTDADDRVRLAAVSALGRIHNSRSAELLAAALADEDPKVAAAAANGLEAQAALALDPTFKLLGHNLVEVRVRATDVLGRLRHKGACERLIQGLSDATVWVRIVSAQALGEIGESRAAPALVNALSDRDPVVRAMAAEALGKLRDFRATMPLLDRLKDESDLVRACALRAVGEIGNPIGAEFLLAALDDPEPEIRAAAIDGLAGLRVTRALPQLRRMARPWPLSKQPRIVKQAALRAVEILEIAEMREAELPESEQTP